MSDQVGTPEYRISRVTAHIIDKRNLRQLLYCQSIIEAKLYGSCYMYIATRMGQKVL